MLPLPILGFRVNSQKKREKVLAELGIASRSGLKEIAGQQLARSIRDHKKAQKAVVVFE